MELRKSWRDPGGAEALMAAALRDLLARREAAFEAAAQHVVEKNAELYRRLAQCRALMTRFLIIAEVLQLYARVVAISGGAFAIATWARSIRPSRNRGRHSMALSCISASKKKPQRSDFP